MIFLGDIPPPLHGMSAINKQMLDEIKKHKKVFFINTSPTWLSRYYHTRFWLLIKAIYFIPVTILLLWAIIFRREKVLYRSLNGGYGQVFDFCWLSIARLFALKVFLHHHAALYLTSRSKLFDAICKITNFNAVHIVLGDAMHDALSTNYNIDQKKIRILSNAAFFKINDAKKLKSNPNEIVRIGYLANLSLSKGIDVFLKTITHLNGKGLKFEAIVAGPCHDSVIRAQLDTACSQLSELKYVGGLYGSDKDNFFEALDCFIYPSRNEAEPLVIYEAAVEGALVLSSEAGCMKSSAQRLQGWSMPLDSPDVWAEAAANKILLSSEAMGLSSREIRKEVFYNFAAEARENLDRIIKEMVHAKA